MAVMAGEWIRYADVALANAGFESHALEAQLLAAHSVGEERSALLAHPEWELPLAANELLERRLRREPLAYILGYREFYGRRFIVDRRVLVPRHDTETLIDAFFSIESALPKDAKVLDLGTGSGCIGLTLALERPRLQATLSDVSADALEVARENAEALGAKVVFRRADLFAFDQQTGATPQFDVVVANPPYIGEEEPLSPEVRQEPAEALFAGPGGMDIYRRIAAEALEYLTDSGVLLLEIGYRQAERVRKTFNSKGWKFVESFRDLSGIERVMMFSPHMQEP